MEQSSVITQVRKGMEVRTTDDKSMGKVEEVWLGADPTSSTQRCDEEICSRLEVRQGGFLRRGETLYIPYSALANVTGNVVHLNVDEATAHSRGWTRRPHWVEQ